MSAVLAHAGQFTWDEALMVLAPVALIFGVLALANRRATRLHRERAAARGAAPQDAERPAG
ncbi:MAG: hypothetical protein MUF83_09035 [Acidimicrobiales bacterium]|jgi:hypothetical protein|nr:hypothetical protein [Acidimicrobiales bacterium]